MKKLTTAHSQRGVSLVVSLLFLLVVTIISVFAAREGSQKLKMTANMQDSYSSFQQAEAGAMAAFGLWDTANNPFNGQDNLDPFAGFGPADHPLRDLNEAGSVDVDVFLTTEATSCPRSQTTNFSADLVVCEYYRIESEHDVPNKARSKVNLGVVLGIIGTL